MWKECFSRVQAVGFCCTRRNNHILVFVFFSPFWTNTVGMRFAKPLPRVVRMWTHGAGSRRRTACLKPRVKSAASTLTSTSTMYSNIPHNGCGVWGRNEHTLRVSGMDPASKVHGVNMGPIWGRQDRGGPHEFCCLGKHRHGVHFPQKDRFALTYHYMQLDIHYWTTLVGQQRCPLEYVCLQACAIIRYTMSWNWEL